MDFVNLLFGHLVGDYLLQNKWIAMNKSGNTFKCFIHCIIYTFCVCTFVQDYSFKFWQLVFLLLMLMVEANQLL